MLDGWSVGQSDIQSIGTRVGQSAIQSSHYHLAMYVYRFAVKSSAWYSPPFVHHYIVFCDVSVTIRLSMVSFKDLLLMWCGYDAPELNSRRYFCVSMCTFLLCVIVGGQDSK